MVWLGVVAFMFAMHCGTGRAATSSVALKLPLPDDFHASVVHRIDANGDQRTDLFVGNAGDGPDQILLNKKQGWRAVALDTGGGRTLAAAVADLDRDGHEDIVIGKSTGLALAMGDGKGGFKIHWLSREGATAWSLAVADLNNDGWVDLIAGRRAASGNSPLVWISEGVHDAGAVPRFHPSGAIAGCCDIGAVALADLRIDGYLDLMVLHDDGTINAYINDSEGHLREQPAMLPPGPWSGMAVHDIDNNVAADVFVYRQKADGGPPVYRLLHNNGQGGFTDVTAASGLQVKRPIERAWWVDANTDGFQDLMLADASGGALEMIPQIENLKFRKPATLATGGLVPGPTLISGDLNQQGDLELIGPMRNAALGILNIGSQKHHWVGLRLTAKDHAPVLGTFAVLTRPDGSVVTGQLTSTGPLLLGLGWRTQVSVMAIYWANGIISRIHPDRVNKYWDFTQPDNPYRGAGRSAAPR